jgi:hypothetical protein
LGKPSFLNRANPLIFKSDDFEIEIFSGTDVYFASKKLGQIFIKWNDLETNEKLRLELLQKKVEKLFLEAREILFAKEKAGNLLILKDDRS